MNEGTPGIRILCPTRWTVEADTMKSIIAMYGVLQECWTEALAVTNHTETKVRVICVQFKMLQFDFWFRINPSSRVFRHCDDLLMSPQKAIRTIKTPAKPISKTSAKTLPKYVNFC